MVFMEENYGHVKRANKRFDLSTYSYAYVCVKLEHVVGDGNLALVEFWFAILPPFLDDFSRFEKKNWRDDVEIELFPDNKSRK